MVSFFFDHTDLCSVEHGDLDVLRSAMELCKQSFHIAAPIIWNSLPEECARPPSSKGGFSAVLKPTSFSRPTPSGNFLLYSEFN